MKGLWIKDLRLMLGQKQFLAMMLLLGAVYLFMYDDPSFGICFITMMCAMFTISTISYDEYENGMSYLFALPVDRKRYVREKYLFGVVMPVLGFALMSVLTLISVSIRRIDFGIKEWIVIGIACLLIITLVLAVNIPLQMKFGAEKSRMALMAVTAAAFAAAYLIVKICTNMGVDIDALFEQLEGMSLAACAGCVCIVCAAVMLVSYQIASRIMQKKEF